MKKVTSVFRKFSLTQQVMVLILLMVGFLTVFFFFFLSDNIDSTITKQIYSMLETQQEPIARALETGKSQISDKDLFEYLGGDVYQTSGIINEKGSMVIFKGQDSYLPEFDDYLEQKAQELLEDPIGSVVQGHVKFEERTEYYRLNKVKTPNGPQVVFSYMDNTYGDDLRTTLLDSTIYVTVLAFFLILMIFVFWVFSIIHPLNQIKAYIAQIKQGKDVDLYINRDDEIGEVAKELRTLTSELAKQEKSKEEMIHNISHDLKTPIATIKSYSESIKDGIYPYGDLESSVDVILDNAERLEQKVHSLLYMNRVEYLVSSDASGVVTNMKDVVEQVVLNAAVVRKDIEIQTDVEEVFFDGLFESWRVATENIMENAFRYAKTYIKIQVRENELIISNDGPKMPEDRIESLFKPYIKGEGGRFGLGLSIVSKVVAANKYKVEGLNTEDGVAFRIYRDVPASGKSKSYINNLNLKTQSVHWGKGQNDKKAPEKKEEPKGGSRNSNAKKKQQSRNKSRKNRSGKNKNRSAQTSKAAAEKSSGNPQNSASQTDAGKAFGSKADQQP